MNKYCLRVMFFAAAVLAMAGSAEAQFRASLMLEHETVLQGEPVRAYLTVTNDSLYPYVVGKSSAEPESLSLDFRVVRTDSGVPKRVTQAVLANGLSLEPGDGITLNFDIRDWYDLFEKGKYRISIQWTLEGKTFESAPILLEVIGGLELLSVTKEVPFAGGAKRAYSLRYWPRDGAEHLFLRVNSDDNLTMYGVFELGELVRIFEPTITIDRFGTIVVMHQVAMGQYRRSELKSTGEGVRFVAWSDVDESGNPFNPDRRPGPADAISDNP